MVNPPSTAFNSVDYFVLFTFGLSMLAGYLRGFMKEVVSLITLIAAVVVATLFSGKLAPIISGYGTQAAQSVANSLGTSAAGAQQSISVVAIGVSFVALFLATMLAGYLVNTIVTGLTLVSGQSLTNRFLGALFGGIRGFIFVIILMFIAELTPMGVQPAWGQSQFVKSFHPVVAWVDKMVHPGLSKIRQKVESVMGNVNAPGGVIESVTEKVKNAGSQAAGLLNPGQ